MGSGGDWRRTGGGLEVDSYGLEVDSMDEMWTGGGVHKDPWGSVIYRLEPPWQQCTCWEILTTILTTNFVPSIGEAMFLKQGDLG